MLRVLKINIPALCFLLGIAMAGMLVTECRNYGWLYNVDEYRRVAEQAKNEREGNKDSSSSEGYTGYDSRPPSYGGSYPAGYAPVYQVSYQPVYQPVYLPVYPPGHPANQRSWSDMSIIHRPTRTYWKNKVSGQARSAKVEFTVPDIPQGQFAVIQFWFSPSKQSSRTVEVGITQPTGGSYWIPFLYNTDDDNKSVYENDRYIEFESGGWTEKRTKYKLEEDILLEAGDHVKMEISLLGGKRRLWVNDKYIGYVREPFKSSYSDFGTEVKSGREPIVLDDLKIVYKF